jgi:guanine deaminase
MAESYEFTVYRGTFIQLPRVDVSRTKPELVRNRGALWVSSTDGRIKGFDWQARGDASFQALMSRNGWVDVDAAFTGNAVNGATVKVKIVVASEDRNEFFFPGFVGMYFVLFTPITI